MTTPTLRRADAADGATLFAWRNRPEIVSLGASGRTVERAEHDAWFARLLADPDALQLIIEVDGEPAGQIRFVAAEEPGSWEVSIYLVGPHLGHGLGSAALRQACTVFWAELPAERVHAVVRRDNEPSRRMFERLGFVAVDRPPPAPSEGAGLEVFVAERPDG